MRAIVPALFALLSLALPLACADTSASRGCAPNSTQSCQCSNNASGVETCSADGTVFSACDCSGGGLDGGGSSSSGSSSGGSGSGSGSGGGCIDTTTSTQCASTSQCCQSGPDQPRGAICAAATGSTNYLCHAVCTQNADCVSSCCVSVNGGGSVCAPSSQCTSSCVAPGGACSTTSNCCQSGSGVSNGATCVTFSSGNECAATCYHNSQCQSNCCAQLQNSSYGACVSNPSSTTTCLP